jgi:hypothetical protein
MKRSSLTFTVLTLCFWIRSEPTMANDAQLEICSAKDKNTALLIAVVHRNYALYPLGDSWIARGWWTIQPGACQTVGALAIGMPVYLSVRRSTNIGPLVNHYDLHNGPVPNNTSVGIERFFCVQPQPFDRVRPSLIEHGTCPSGWHKQLFNLYIFVERNTQFKLTL